MGLSSVALLCGLFCFGALGCGQDPPAGAQGAQAMNDGDGAGDGGGDEAQDSPGPPMPRSAEDGAAAEGPAGAGAATGPADAEDRLAPDAEGASTAVDPELEACSGLGDDPAWPYPRTIQAAVDRINALPRPVSLPCFLASLPRPLSMVATMSVTSAQPAAGERSPRIFLMHPSLIMSVVPDGVGQPLLEFGEFRTETRTLKAELEFPIEEELTPQDPFVRLVYEDSVVTSCGFCHRNEEQADEGHVAAVTSAAIAPHWSSDIEVAQVAAENAACVAEDEPARCALLQALFSFGTVEQGEFPEQIPGFF